MLPLQPISNKYKKKTTMKNVVKMAAVAAMMLVSSNTVNAQKVEYGPKAHDFSVEVQFNPFSNNFETFKIDGLSGRYFITDKDAIRATLKIGVSSKETNPFGNLVEPRVENYSSTIDYTAAMDRYNHQKDATSTSNAVNLGLSVGYERHLYRSGRMDIFAGGQLGFDINAYDVTIEKDMSYNYNTASGLSQWKTLKSEVSGADYDPMSSGASGHKSNCKFYGGVFTGVDFYVLKNLYLGAELGLSASFKAAGDIEVSGDSMDNSGNVTSTTNNVTVKDNSFDMGFYVTPAIRLGWKF